MILTEKPPAFSITINKGKSLAIFVSKIAAGIRI